jgi:hypothetical protein
MSDEHDIRGRIEACRWSYERTLTSEDSTETVISAQLTVTGAVYDISGRPVTLATVKFGKPAGGSIGKIKGSSTYELSVTMPVADLPSFAAVFQGNRPVLLESVVLEGDRSVQSFRVLSDGFQGD